MSGGAQNREMEGDGLSGRERINNGGFGYRSFIFDSSD